MKRISFVLPVHNEREVVVEFHKVLTSELNSLGDYEFDFVYVDDGSTDGSLEQLRHLGASDNRVRVVSLSRNFGHQLALTAGLDRADGDAVIIMDTDLQDPPNVVPSLIAEWELGADCVNARRISRNDSVFKRWTAKAFYWWLSRVSEVDLPRDVGDFRLVDKSVVAQVRQFRESDRYLRGMFAYLGHSQAFVDFRRDARAAGKSSYGIAAMLKLATGGVMGFSSAPLKMVRNVGLMIAGIAFAGALYVFLGRLIEPNSTVPGWAFTVISILFVGGVQIVMLSIVGSYVGRIYTEVKNRPLYGIAFDTGLESSDL